MGHTPHLYCRPPWDDSRIELEPATRRHLERALRRSDEEPVTYTDGEGCHGSGVLDGEAILRGRETTMPPCPDLTIAVAAPHRKVRARYVVEKLAELGVARPRYLATAHGAGFPPLVPTRRPAGRWRHSNSRPALTSWPSTVR